MNQFSSESPKAPAPEGGSDPEVSCMGKVTFDLSDAGNRRDLADVLAVLGVLIKDRERFDFGRESYALETPGGHQKEGFVKVSYALKPENIPARKELRVPSGHGPVGPETD